MMNNQYVLFVSRLKKDGSISPIVNRQFESLNKVGCRIELFTIKGQGILGYIWSLFRLQKHLRHNRQITILHAHYSNSGWLAWMAKGKRKLIVSYMGSDVISRFHNNFLSTFLPTLSLKWNLVLSKYSYDHTIVKSKEMASYFPGLQKLSVIPNGVNIEIFRPVSRDIAREKVSFSLNKKYVIFVSDPERIEKNFLLADRAVKLINSSSIELFVVKGVAQKDLLWYYNAADVLLLTSLYEGSPNVIKEAMACGCPVVSTKVGDVDHIFGDSPGHYLVDSNPSEISIALSKAIHYRATHSFTKGRERIKEIELCENDIARKLINIYSNL